MAGRHTDAARALQTMATIGFPILASYLGVTATYNKLWPSATSLPPALKTLPAYHHRPGGLSHVNKSTFGDYFQQAANPVCAVPTEPFSTYLDFLAALLLLANSLCFPSEAPTIPAFKHPDGSGLRWTDIVRLFLDLMTSVFPLVYGTMPKKVMLVSVLFSLLSGCWAASTVQETIASMFMNSFWLLIQGSKSTLMYILVSGAEPYILDFFRGMPTKTQETDRPVPRNALERMILILCHSLAPTVVELAHEIALWTEKYIGNSPRIDYCLQVVAPRTVYDEKLHEVKLAGFFIIPLLCGAFPRYRGRLTLALVLAPMLVACALQSPTVLNLLFHAESKVLGRLGVAVFPLIYIHSPTLWRILRREFNSGHQQQQAHRALGQW